MFEGRKCVSPGFGFYLSRLIFAVLKAVTVKIIVLRYLLPCTFVDR
jgi:hypothetical protein